MSFRHLKPGDMVDRTMRDGNGGMRLMMKMVVSKLEGDVIHCKAIQDDGTETPFDWTFDADRGFEIDEELGWGRQPDGSILTGTVLCLKASPEQSDV